MVRGGVGEAVGGILSELLDLLDLAGQFVGESLLQRLQLSLLVLL